MWFVGLDVHEATTAVSIRNDDGVVLLRDVVPTDRASLRRFFGRFRCRMRIAVEAGAIAPRIAAVLSSERRQVIVCDGRRNKLLAHGSKTDRVDADKLSELLRLDAVRPVFIGDEGTQRLRRLSHHYLRLMADRTRVIQRLRAFLGAIGVSFTRSTFSRRAVPLRAIRDSASKLIARALLAHVETLTPLIAEARRAFLSEASRYSVHSLLQSVPYIGPIRAAELIALVGEPARFPSVRSFWAYAGLAVEYRTSSEHRIESGRVPRDHHNGRQTPQPQLSTSPEKDPERHRARCLAREGCTARRLRGPRAKRQTPCDRSRHSCAAHRGGSAGNVEITATIRRIACLG